MNAIDPPPGAHGVDVEGRRLQRIAVHLQLARELRPAVVDERDVGRCSAHVERDELTEARAPSHLEAAHDPGGGSGQHRPDGLRPRGLERHHPAVALRDVRQRADTRVGEARTEARQIARHQGTEVGVHHHRGQPLVLAELGGHLVRAGDERLGQLLFEDALDALLVTRIHVAVEEAHRDRADAGGFQAPGGRAHLRVIERLLDAAVVAHALGHLHAQRPRHEQERLVGLEVVEMRAALAADLEEVAKPLGRHEPGRGAAVLDERVGGDGGAVPEVGDVAGGGLRRLAQAFHRAERDGARGIVRRARHLPHADVTGRFIEEADVGEGPPGVDADAPHGGESLSRLTDRFPSS